MRRLSISLLVSLLSSAVLLNGCISDSAPPTVPPPAPETTTTTSPEGEPGASAAIPASPVPEQAATSQSPPLPTSAEMSVEGEVSSIALDPYRPDGVPVEMGLPEGSFTPVVDQGLRWTAVQLVASAGGVTNEDAYVAVVWPKDSTDLDQALSMLMGDRGWVQQQGFELIDSTATAANPNQPVYSWQRQRWQFQKTSRSGELIVGEVILGELNGQGFWIVEHLPMEYVEGYGPRIRIVLDTLQGRQL